MTQTLELSDIQATALRHRPMPYCGAYVFLRINDPEHARTLLSRLIPKITTSAEWQKPVDESWINLVFTHSSPWRNPVFLREDIETTAGRGGTALGRDAER
jgi:hypothetical protein